MRSSSLKIMKIVLVTFLKYLLFSSNNVLVYIKQHQYHQHWQHHAYLMINTLKQFCLLLYQHLQHIGNHFRIDDCSIQQLLFWWSKKSSSRFYAFFVWHNGDVGQTCATSICLLHSLCRGTVYITIKHNIAVSVFSVQIIFV